MLTDVMISVADSGYIEKDNSKSTALKHHQRILRPPLPGSKMSLCKQAYYKMDLL